MWAEANKKLKERKGAWSEKVGEIQGRLFKVKRKTNGKNNFVKSVTNKI